MNERLLHIIRATSNCDRNLMTTLDSLLGFNELELKVLESISDPICRAYEMYTFVMKRPNGLRRLLNALYECKQTAAYEVLKLLLEGHCLLVNVIDFDQPKYQSLMTWLRGCFNFLCPARNDFDDPTRHGAEYDTDRIRTCFESQGYSVTEVTGHVSKARLEKSLNEFKAKVDAKNNNRPCVVYIASHGSYSQIATSDGVVHLYEDIIYKFNPRNNVPKWFLVHACQDFQTIPTAYPDTGKQRPIENAVVLHSAMPGFSSVRYPHGGSPFTRCVTNVVDEYGDSDKILDLNDKIQEAMETIPGIPGSEEFKYGLTCLYNRIRFDKKSYL